MTTGHSNHWAETKRMLSQSGRNWLERGVTALKAVVEDTLGYIPARALAKWHSSYKRVFIHMPWWYPRRLGKQAISLMKKCCKILFCLCIKKYSHCTQMDKPDDPCNGLTSQFVTPEHSPTMPCCTKKFPAGNRPWQKNPQISLFNTCFSCLFPCPRFPSCCHQYILFHLFLP